MAGERGKDRHTDCLKLLETCAERQLRICLQLSNKFVYRRRT